MRHTVRLLRTAWHGLAAVALISAWAVPPATLTDAANAVRMNFTLPEWALPALAAAPGGKSALLVMLALWALGSLVLWLGSGLVAATAAPRPRRAERKRRPPRGRWELAGELHDRLP